MTSVCLYFQVHQPRRLRRYGFFDIGRSHEYEDEEGNRVILEKVAAKCYRPANALLLDLIERYRGAFRVSFSITGVLLEHLERHCPDVVEGFQRLGQTGAVEFLAESYYHSLASLFSPREFREQVDLHCDKMQEVFRQRPRSFRYTELIYSNDLAQAAEKMGYTAILAEGAERLLGDRSPNRLYRPRDCTVIKLLLRNYRLSDDVAFRFSNRDWPDYPLTASKYAHWIHQCPEEDRLINLFMDYETFGEHQWTETGIFAFLQALPGEILKNNRFRFQTPSEIAQALEPEASLDMPELLSWADTERDLTAWQGNAMQKDAIESLYRLEEDVRRRGDDETLAQWRLLQTSDHFYYMCTKWSADGDVHRYFNPYPSSHDAYIHYMNIIDDFSRSLRSRRSAAGLAKPGPDAAPEERSV